MALTQDERNMIRDLYSRNYGLPTYAQRDLSDRGLNVSLTAIVDTWAMPPELKLNKYDDIISKIIKNYYRLCNGNVYQIQSRLKQETIFNLCDESIRRQLRKLGLKSKTPKEKYVGRGKSVIQKKSGKRIKGNYVFSESPDAISSKLRF